MHIGGSCVLVSTFRGAALASCRVLAGAGWSVADQRPGLHFQQVTGGEQGGRWTAVLAGGWAVSMTASRAARTAGRSATSRTKDVNFPAAPKPAPAAASHRRRFSNICRACAAGSPGPASSPRSSCAIWPLTTTSRPGRRAPDGSRAQRLPGGELPPAAAGPSASILWVAHLASDHRPPLRRRRTQMARMPAWISLRVAARHSTMSL